MSTNVYLTPSLWNKNIYGIWFWLDFVNTEILYRNWSVCSVVVVQLLSCIWVFVNPWTVAHQDFLSFTFSPSLFKHMSTESVMSPNHLILWHLLLLLPSVFPSISIFSSESALFIRWSKYWSFSFSICPSKEYSVLLFFRVDWFDFFAVQGTGRVVIAIANKLFRLGK